MKKITVLSMGMCAVLALASCGTSKESAYKKAYEKAQQQEQQAGAECGSGWHGVPSPNRRHRRLYASRREPYSAILDPCKIAASVPPAAPASGCG